MKLCITCVNFWGCLFEKCKEDVCESYLKAKEEN